jgi:hypothetical protein
MNTSAYLTPSSALTLPTEEQVVAFFKFHTERLQSQLKLRRIHLQVLAGKWGNERTVSCDFYLTHDGPSHCSGKTLEEAVAKFEQQNGPASKLELAMKKRAEAEALEQEAAALVVEAGPFLLTAETRILIVEDNRTTTWGEFVQANDGAEEVMIARDELCRRGQARIGGGAAPVFTLKIAA